MDNLTEAHYFMLPNQGNVYSLKIFNLCSDVNKFIVATLKKKIYLFEFSETSEGALKEHVKEIPFTSIPNGAEIISVDVFNKSTTCDDFQIGITTAKLNADGSYETHLIVYFEQDLDSNNTLNIDSIAQNCSVVELGYIPYQLTHTYLFHRLDTSDSKEIVWLLSGADNLIHLIVEDRQNHSYSEIDISEHFPDLNGVLPSVAIWIDVQYTLDFTRRVSVVGCECGILQISSFDTTTKSLIYTECEVFDGTITQAKLFSLTPKDLEPPDLLKAAVPECNKASCSKDIPENDIHLVVCNGVIPSVVYMNVDKNGLRKRQNLDESELYDATLCAGFADINFDGFYEILLGTFGKKILMYTWNGTRWELSGQRMAGNAVHSLNYVDLTDDGVRELVVQTTSGVHILQHDPKEVHKIVLSRLQNDSIGKEIFADILIEDTSEPEPALVEEPLLCTVLEEEPTPETEMTIQTFISDLPVEETPVEIQDPPEDQTAGISDILSSAIGACILQTPIVVSEPLPEAIVADESMIDTIDTIEEQKPLPDTHEIQKPESEVEDCPCEEANEQTFK